MYIIMARDVHIMFYNIKYLLTFQYGSMFTLNSSNVTYVEKCILSNGINVRYFSKHITTAVFCVFFYCFPSGHIHC